MKKYDEMSREELLPSGRNWKPGTKKQKARDSSLICPGVSRPGSSWIWKKTC